jgi:ubiquitin related modifier 1
MLFDNRNRHEISIPAKDPRGLPANINFLVRYLCDNTMKDSRKELFVVDAAVYDRCFPLYLQC